VGTTPDQLKSEIDATREDLTNNVNALADKVSPARITRRRLQAVKETATGVKDKVVGGASSASSGVTGTASSVASTASDAPGQLAQTARGNPLPAALLALGAGAVVANLLPSTTGERRIAETMNDNGVDLLDTLKQAATQSGQQLKGQLTPQAQQALSAVKDRAGQAVEETKQQAESASQDVAEHGQKAATRVRGKAQTAKTKTVAKAKAGTSTTSRPRTSTAKPSDIHVVHKNGSWVVEQKGAGVISTHRTQALAEEAGRRRARRDKTEFVLHAMNGQIRQKDSYGNDPRGTKG
jgi:gas vesicle protein